MDSEKDFTKVKTSDLVEAVQGRGYFVTKQPLIVDYEKKVDLKRFARNAFRFAVISDTHLGLVTWSK